VSLVLHILYYYHVVVVVVIVIIIIIIIIIPSFFVLLNCLFLNPRVYLVHSSPHPTGGGQGGEE